MNVQRPDGDGHQLKRGSHYGSIDRSISASRPTTPYVANNYQDLEQLQQEMAVRNTIGSVELLVRFFSQEMQILRFHIRQRSAQFREFLNTFIAKGSKFCRRRLRKFLLSFPVHESVCFDGDAAMIFNEVPAIVEPKVADYNLNDVEVVMTTDEELDGIIHRNVLLFPKWECLPKRVLPICAPEEQISEFQLFNKPLSMAMTLEDDEDHLSLGSTKTGMAETLQSMEAQVAMLTKQLQFFMNSKNMEKDVSPERASVTSEDEGKGASVCSPSSRKKTFKKEKINVEESLPTICPPSGVPPPPPPPPPPDFLRSSVRKMDKITHQPPPTPVVQVDENTVPSEEGGVVRPSVADLRTVHLKKTNTDRSPGGTPLHRSRLTLNRTPNSEYDQGAFLGAALKAKFQAVHENSFSEQEDDNSTWEED